jgi:non-haem Fe2+, alpha-ketoglutarate-dependent halogenase
MPKVLTPQQISMLERDGYVAPISVFSKQSAESFRTALEAFEESVKNEPKEKTLATLARFKPHLLFTWLDNICHNPNLLDIIEDLIGPNILIYSSAFFIKNSNDQAYVPWHQDSIYADFKGGKQVRAWVAFTHSNTSNGCMRVIKGSHKKQFKHIDDPSDENNILFRKEKISENVDERLAADLILRPGEMSVHNYGVIHGSEPNFSDDRRIGFAIAFVTPDTIATGRNETAMLARGYASKKDWALEPRPLGDIDNNARIAHARAMEIREGHFYNTDGAIAE